jgi:hypothetical protein
MPSYAACFPLSHSLRAPFASAVTEQPRCFAAHRRRSFAE